MLSELQQPLLGRRGSHDGQGGPSPRGKAPPALPGTLSSGAAAGGGLASGWHSHSGEWPPPTHTPKPLSLPVGVCPSPALLLSALLSFPAQAYLRLTTRLYSASLPSLGRFGVIVPNWIWIWLNTRSPLYLCPSPIGLTTNCQ